MWLKFVSDKLHLFATTMVLNSVSHKKSNFIRRMTHCYNDMASLSLPRCHFLFTGWLSNQDVNSHPLGCQLDPALWAAAAVFQARRMQGQLPDFGSSGWQPVPLQKGVSDEPLLQLVHFLQEDQLLRAVQELRQAWQVLHRLPDRRERLFSAGNQMLVDRKMPGTGTDHQHHPVVRRLPQVLPEDAAVQLVHVWWEEAPVLCLRQLLQPGGLRQLHFRQLKMWHHLQR